jgi:zinc protease
MTSRGLAPVRAVLANGATVIAKTSPATPAVTLHASIQAGSIFDPPAAPGLAHFVSRVIDRGTTTRSADDLAEALDSRGVSLATSVNRHAISLVCTCIAEDFDAVLLLLADVIMNAAFPEEEVETRRGEIVTMIRQDEDNPATVAMEALMSTLYGADHPYGRRPRGTTASVDAIDRVALQGFHRSRVIPPALSLVVVGDIEPHRAIEAAGLAFGAWPAAASPISRPLVPADLVPPAPIAERIVRVMPMMNKAQADIAYGFTSVTRADPRYYAFWLMNNILGQYSIGGRLGDSIRERQGMAYYVFSGLDANVIPGPLLVRAGVSAANIERAVASIDAELSRMAADGPTENEIAESKQYLIGSLPRTLETNVGIANYLQNEEFFGLGFDYDLRVPGLLHAVTRDDVHEAARAVLDPSRAVVVVAGPYTGTLS